MPEGSPSGHSYDYGYGIFTIPNGIVINNDGNIDMGFPANIGKEFIFESNAKDFIANHDKNGNVTWNGIPPITKAPLEEISQTTQTPGYMLIEYKNKTLIGDPSYLSYDDFGNNIIEIPIPKDGETLYTDITYPLGDYIYKITEVRRDGDVIYFKDNQIPAEEIFGGEWEDGNGTWSYQHITIDKEEAIRNKESYIYHIVLFLILDEPQVYPNPGNRGIISITQLKKISVIDCNDSTNRLFDIDAETLRLGVGDYMIIQYGN
jgi:hypothetical protein